MGSQTNKYRAFWSWRYRVSLWAHRYFRWQDPFQILMFVAAGVLAVNSYTTEPEVSLAAGIVYLLSLAVYWFIVINSREARDYVQGEVVWDLFNQLNQQAFHDEDRTRFTLFKPAPLRRNEIIPWYRFEKSGSNAIEEAHDSRVHYKRGEGYTGRAWAKPNKLICGLLPHFDTREQMSDFYANSLEIRRSVVNEISEHMEQVQTVFSYGFVNHRNQLLGVLSLDVAAPLRQEESNSGTLSFPTESSSDEDTVVDTRRMRLILQLVRGVLESFNRVERR